MPPGDPSAVPPVPERALPALDALTLAQSLLDEGRAFGAHEVLEASWKAAPAGERDLWQGLAQLCVGVTHLQRGNTVGAARLLRRAAGRLPAAPPYGIDPGLGDWALSLADRLEAGGLDAAGLPAGGLPAGGLPAGGLPAGGLPAGGPPAAGLPAAGLPAAGLPAAGLPAAGLPAAGLPRLRI